MSRVALARAATLTGYFGLLILLLAWNAWLAPGATLPVALTLIVMIGPLLFPLRGLLHGKPYTHAWVSMLSLLYFTHGVVEAWADPSDRIYALMEVVFSTLLFGGSMLYARWRARELKAI